MSRRTQKSVRASCDRLWSQLVRARAGHVCERCDRFSDRLEAHHAYGRANYRLRFEPRNGVSLCFKCHVWAESYPILFADWFRATRPEDASYLETEHRAGLLKRTLADYLRLEDDLEGQLVAALADREDAA